MKDYDPILFVSVPNSLMLTGSLTPYVGFLILDLSFMIALQ